MQNSISESIVDILIFEDENSQHAALVEKLLDGKVVKAYCKDMVTKIDADWNNLGNRLLIRNADTLRAAITRCQTARGKAILFFDMSLKIDVTCSDADLFAGKEPNESDASFIERKKDYQKEIEGFLLAATAKKDLAASIEFLNQEGLQGFLVLAHALKNSYLDSDIYIASQFNADCIKWDNLTVLEIKKIGIVSSLSKPTTTTRLQNGLCKAIEIFSIKRPCDLDILTVIWQDHFKERQAKWFKTDELKYKDEFPIPHSPSVFLQWYDTPEKRVASEVGVYLRSLLAFGYRRQNLPAQNLVNTLSQFETLEKKIKEKIDVIVEWLVTSARFWYLLQRVFGKDRIWVPEKIEGIKTQANFPGHGSFLLLLLAATGPGNWGREDFTFAIEGSTESEVRDSEYWIFAQEKSEGSYSETDLDGTRKILRSAFELFDYLSGTEPKVPGNPLSNMLVSFSQRSNIGFFSLSVNFSATRRFKENRNRPSILARSQFAQVNPSSLGACLTAYADFQRACEPAVGGDRCVFSWILPGIRPNGWTEFLIGVVNRGK